jgi:hypothetical protein
MNELDALVHAMEAIKVENRVVDKIFMSSSTFEEMIKSVPMIPAHDKSLVGHSLMGIPVIIDDMSGYKIIAFDRDGWPLLMVQDGGMTVRFSFEAEMKRPASAEKIANRWWIREVKNE